MNDTEIRTRFVGAGVQALYRAVVSGDTGKRHILHDNLGLLAAVPDGWELTIPDHPATTHSTHDGALDEAKRLLS